ncbi:hypothetical protein Tco_0650807 [Tanacetum coccineum]
MDGGIVNSNTCRDVAVLTAREQLLEPSALNLTVRLLWSEIPEFRTISTVEPCVGSLSTLPVQELSNFPVEWTVFLFSNLCPVGSVFLVSLDAIDYSMAYIFFVVLWRFCNLILCRGTSNLTLRGEFEKEFGYSKTDGFWKFVEHIGREPTDGLLN